MNKNYLATFGSSGWRKPPSRAELCGGEIRFQGVTCNTSQYGIVPTFGPEVSSYNATDRQRHYAALKSAGATVIEFAISWNYQESNFHYPVPGTDLSKNLPQLADLIIEALSTGLFDGINYNDPAGWTYGWQWLMAQTPPIIQFFKNYKGIDLTKYILFIPGYDGVVPGWAGPENNWHRVNEWIALAKSSGANYIGLELSAGYPNWSGEGVSDYSSPEGQLLDTILYETPCPMGPTNFPVPDDFCNQSSDVRAPFDQVWQILSRLLGRNYRRPSDQPACDDPNPQPNLPLTPRGPYFVYVYEYDTYRWVRNAVSAQQIEIEKEYFYNLGAVCVG